MSKKGKGQAEDDSFSKPYKKQGKWTDEILIIRNYSSTPPVVKRKRHDN